MAIAKFVGHDCELSTTGALPSGAALDPWWVTCEILDAIGAAFEDRGLRVWSERCARRPKAGAFRPWRDSSDCLRHWCPNGQCFYADMSHLEVCTAECLSPRDYAAQSLAALRVVEAARQRAEQRAEPGTRFALTAANADVCDPAVSWGAHFNVAITRELWEELLLEPQRPAVLGFVSSAIAAVVPFFGAGYLLPLDDGTARYSLSARVHHLSRLRTESTTEAFHRGLLNARREPHGGPHERLHLIGFDYNLIGAALKCSLMQCALAAAEEGFAGLQLLDPIRAARSWSFGLNRSSLTLPALATLVDGRQLTLGAFMRTLAQTLLDMCEGRLISDNVAPQARDLLPRIIELAAALERGDIAVCARNLDWAAKLLCLVDLAQAPEIRWGDAAMRLADHDFAHTDPSQGLIWQLWDRQLVDPLVTQEDIEQAMRWPPQEARGWARGGLIRERFDQVLDVDWSYVDMRRTNHPGSPPVRVDLSRLDDPRRDHLPPSSAPTDRQTPDSSL